MAPMEPDTQPAENCSEGELLGPNSELHDNEKEHKAMCKSQAMCSGVEQIDHIQDSKRALS